MKKLITLLLAFIMILSLIACNNDSGNSSDETSNNEGTSTNDATSESNPADESTAPDTSPTFDEENAIEASPKKVYDDVMANEARAMQNTYKVTGEVWSISADYIDMNNLQVYLPTDILVSLNKGDTITFIGKINRVEVDVVDVVFGTEETTIIIFTDVKVID